MKIESLMDLTIEDYLMITSLNGKDEDFIKKEMLRYFNLGHLSIVEAEDFMNNLGNILKTDAKFIQRFELNGVEYGFIPNLLNHIIIALNLAKYFVIHKRTND